MPAVIVDQPWPPDVGEDLIGPSGTPIVDPTTNRTLRAYHDQIVLWGTFAPRSLVSLPVGHPFFPLVLDTGFNDAFLMQERQAEDWLTPSVVAQLPVSGKSLSAGATRIPFREAALWISPNVPGTRVPDPSQSPVRLALPFGVALTPPGSPLTREKPLLGLLAVRFNRLTVRIDGQHQRVWIDTP